MANEIEMLQPEWADVTRALVIMAHPDDPDFICAGTTIQMVNAGIEVTYMILTNGDKGNHNPDITRNELIELRKREQRAAAETSGVQHIIFMGEEDGFLRPTFELRKRVVREIRRIHPELIICPSPERYLVGGGYINHPDHRNAGLVALEAIFPAADNPMFYPEMADEGYLPHKISQLYVYGEKDANLEIDVTEQIDQKIASIICHKTQIKEPEKLKEGMLERWGTKQEDGTVRHYERYRLLKF